MRIFLSVMLCCVLWTQKTQAQSDRDYWLHVMDKLARPMLQSLSEDKLKQTMPVAISKRTDNATVRKEVAYLEGFARVFSGMAPWLNIEDGDSKEKAMRKQYREWILKGLANGVNPASKDYMNFIHGQSLVDAAYLALALIRCPWAWNNSDTITRKQVVEAFRLTRKIKPGFNNWILFSGMIEAFFCKYGYDWDNMRIEFCIRQMEQWYVGDGQYSDGSFYHWDYYNSFVIHPFLHTIIDVVNVKNGAYKSYVDRYNARDERYALIQERLIAPDGTYPATGRSIVYRGAAFQHLADMVWRKQLPEVLHPAQVRCALTAVLKKTMEGSGTFNKDGWLTIGIYGSQPDLADSYNNTGSLYICSNILLPLGLPASDPFWSNPPEKWTSQKIWSGEDVGGDHAVDK